MAEYDEHGNPIKHPVTHQGTRYDSAGNYAGGPPPNRGGGSGNHDGKGGKGRKFRFGITFILAAIVLVWLLLKFAFGIDVLDYLMID